LTTKSKDALAIEGEIKKEKKRKGARKKPL
jgi:hypothetical protein